MSENIEKVAVEETSIYFLLDPSFSLLLLLLTHYFFFICSIHTTTFILYSISTPNFF
jgi:hypothetical protein